MDKEYTTEKQKIFYNAQKRSQKIIEKYKGKKGYLDGEPWTNELKEDSARVLKELKDLKEKLIKINP